MVNIYKNPPKEDWLKLIQRPQKDTESLQNLVKQIFHQVKNHGDEALLKYTQQFDKIELNTLEISHSEICESKKLITKDLQNAIFQAYNNIKKFHEIQKERRNIIETVEGVRCWRESRPIERIGIYIPGGSAPLFSTVLMLAVPAQIAGCKEVILCTPPNSEGNVHPAILFSASLSGVHRIFKIGGIQAIAAMHYGTPCIPKVYKIFGPGNQYVTAAKEYAQFLGTAIDMPAGPSEVLIIADNNSNPDFIAADLLSQAEHGPDSQVVLLVNSNQILEKTLQSLENQIENLPRKEIALQSLQNSFFIEFNDMETCFEFSNEYAPEHLILNFNTANKWLNYVNNAGSVFVGKYSCESFGDYASGTNHTLPTYGYAKAYSGVSLDSFVKKITFQRISPKGLNELGPVVEIMAENEKLFAHKNAVTIRLNSLKS
jgi:histidinol dehydrogenase